MYGITDQLTVYMPVVLMNRRDNYLVKAGYT